MGQLGLCKLFGPTSVYNHPAKPSFKGSTLSTPYPRDLIGYGPNPPHPHWPNDARIAISFVLNYEEGGERNILHGDKESEAFLSELVAAQPLPGARNLCMESLYEYGSRSGVWRILNLFEKFEIPLTIFAVAMAAQRHPELIRAMAAAGHEICSHGYRWIDYQHVTEAEERAHIFEAVRILTEITGVRPLGWYTGRTGPNTRRLVLEEAGFLYDSDTYDDDLPYWEPTGPTNPAGKAHVVIPYTLDTNDMRFTQVQGFNSGDDFYTYLKDAFDVLYAEGANGAPKMLSIGLHCRLIGRPARLAALQRFIEYARSHDQVSACGHGKNVWFARRIDIARHWHDTHPHPTQAKPAMSNFQTLIPTTLSRAEFIGAFSDIYEHSPWVAERTFDVGLDASANGIAGLHQRMSAQMLSADKNLQLALINAHPDLAGKAAVRGELTEASTAEQSGAGIHLCTESEFARFTELNSAYKAKFGFPFIMAVKGSNRHQILAAFEERIHNAEETEFARALAEINKIALFRLQTL